jgi:hypothetical protein
MITTVGEALEKRCIKYEGNCVAMDCMGWERYVPTVVDSIGGVAVVSVLHGKVNHGVKNALGYCGLSHRR